MCVVFCNLNHETCSFVKFTLLSLLFIRNNTFLFSSQIIYPYSSFSLFIFFMYVVCTADIMHALGLMPSASYFIYLVTSQENSTLAVSLSTNALKLYSPATGQFLGECTGHSGSIHEISFSAPSSPQVICSCSSDGTIRAWDTRSFKQISLLRGSQELFSFSFGGSSGNLLAAGSNSQVIELSFILSQILGLFTFSLN
jgi:WD40 repeat protein